MPALVRENASAVAAMAVRVL
jgi:hypothetical protein